MNFITKKILAEAITRPEALEMLGDFRSKAEAGVFKKDGEKRGSCWITIQYRRASRT